MSGKFDTIQVPSGMARLAEKEAEALFIKCVKLDYSVRRALAAIYLTGFRHAVQTMRERNEREA